MSSAISATWQPRGKSGRKKGNVKTNNKGAYIVKVDVKAAEKAFRQAAKDANDQALLEALKDEPEEAPAPNPLLPKRERLGRIVEVQEADPTKVVGGVVPASLGAGLPLPLQVYPLSIRI